MVASAFPCLREPLKLSAQRSKSIGSGPLGHRWGSCWTTFENEELNEPIRRGRKPFSQGVDPAVSVTLWMNRGRCEYVATSASEVDARKNAGTIPNSGRLHVPMESVAGLNDWASQRFPSSPGLFQGIDGSLAIKINYVEAQAGSQPDVGASDSPSTMPGSRPDLWSRHGARGRHSQRRSTAPLNEAPRGRHGRQPMRTRVPRRDDPLAQSVSAMGEQSANDD